MLRRSQGRDTARRTNAEGKESGPDYIQGCESLSRPRHRKKPSRVHFTSSTRPQFHGSRESRKQWKSLTLRYLGVPIHGSTYLFGDNESVVKSGSIPDSRLAKRHLGLSYHFTREAIASEMVSFHHIPGQINPADVLSKHWAHSQIWTALQPMMFWSGNTGDLLDRA